MPVDGRLKTWNDDRGFGFIEPVRGGPDVFVHISAFPPRAERPRVGERLSFEVEIGDRGRPRARSVALFGVARPGPREARRREASSRLPQARQRMDPATLLFIPAAVILYLLVTAFLPAPEWLPYLYALVSVATFAVYGADKAAARGGGRRMPESTLHLLSLAGGWPGALLAQALLRHKSAKVDFRIVFWATVAGNVALAVFLCSPPGRGFWDG